MTELIDVQLRKGVLELCVLEILGRSDSYAYDIASQLAESIGMGEGTVYPLMRRLHTCGLVDTYLVESSSGPPRKYYKITRAGRAALQRQREAWKAFSASVDRIVGGQ